MVTRSVHPWTVVLAEVLHPGKANPCPEKVSIPVSCPSVVNQSGMINLPPGSWLGNIRGSVLVSDAGRLELSREKFGSFVEMHDSQCR